MNTHIPSLNNNARKVNRPAKRRAPKLASPSAALACAIAVPALATAATVTWTGSNSMDWSASGNWNGTGAAPTSVDIAQFSQAFSNPPSLTSAGNVQGIWLASGLGDDVTIAAALPQTLTIAGNGAINGQSNAGIYMNDPGNHSLTIGPNVTVTLSNNTGFYNQESGGVLTVSGSLNLNNRTLTIGSGTSSLGTVTISGPISASAGGLTVNTASVVTLSSSNAYTGATTVTGGTLAISGAGTLGASGSSALAIGAGILDLNGSSQSVAAVTMTGAGTIRNGTLSGSSYAPSVGSGTATISANVGGSSAPFTKTGLGTVILSGSNNYGGATVVSAGVLQFANPTAVSAGSPSISATGGGVLAVNFGGPSDFTDAQVNTVLGNLTFNATTAAFGVDTTNMSGTLGSNLAMTAGLTKLGSNTLTLTGTNTYTGSTTVTAGTLAVGSAGALPGTTTLSVTGGVFDLNGNNVTIMNLSNGTSTGIITDDAVGSGTSTLSLTSFSSTPTNSLRDGANGQKLAVQLSATAESLSNIWRVGGNSTFSGGLTLTYSGATGRGLRLYVDPVTTTLTSGTITSSSFGTGPITIGLAPTDRVQLFLTSTTTIYNDIIVNSNLGSDQSGTFRMASGAFTLAGTMTANLASIVFFSGSGGYGTTVTGRVTGTNGLTVNAVGCTVTLSGTNDYTGATTISAGTLRALDGIGLPTGSLLTCAGGVLATSGTLVRSLGSAAGNIQITSGATGFTSYSGPATIALGGTATPATLTWGSANFAPSSLVLNDGNADSPLTFANSLDLNGGGRTINVNASTATVSGNIVNGTGTGSLTKTGSGTLVLAGTNSYNGTTSVSSGTLQLGSAAALPATTTLTVNAGAVDLNGYNPTIAALTGSAGTSVITNGGPAVLTISNAISTTFSGSLADGSGSLGLTKSGSGVLILAGSNGYSGPTAVSAGTLQIGAGGTTGSVSMTSGIAVAAGATLALNRTDNYGGNWSVPVSGSGGLTLTAGTLTLSGNSLSYTGTTVNNNGILQLGDGTPGHDGLLSTAALVNNNLQVHFNYYGNQTIAYPISGGGTVWQQGPGTLILTASNSPGLLSILSGTVQLGDGTAGHDGALTVSGGIQNAGALAFNTYGSQTMSSSISGAGSLIKSGAGNLTLSASNSLTGSTQLLSGTLTVGNNNALTSSLLNLSSSGTVVFTVTAPVIGGLSGTSNLSAAGVTTLTLNPAAGVVANYSGAIIGGTNLIVSGVGTQILGGTNTWAGTTTLSSGSLKLGANGAIPSTTALIVNGGVLDLNGNNLTVNTVTAGNSAAVITDNAIGTGTSTFAVSHTGTSVSFAPLISDGANGRKMAVQFSATATQLSGSSFANAGNTFSGGLTLSGTNQLRIQVGSFSATGSAGAITSSNFGTGPVILGTGTGDRVQMVFSGANLTILNNFVINSALGTDFAGAIRVNTTGNVLAGTINAALAPLQFSTSGVSSLNVTGLVTGSNGVSMSTQAANLAVTLSATNNYAGPTVIGSGVLRAVDGVGLPTGSLLTGSGGVFETSGTFTRTLGAAAGNVQITGGVSGFSAYGTPATIAIGGTASPTALTWGSATFAPSTLVLNETTSNSALTFVNSIDLNNGSRAINVNASTATVSGAISNGAGTGNLTKGGAGTLVLSGSNTYNGTTTLSLGTLQVGAAAAIPTTTTLAVNGGVFDLNGNNVTVSNLTVGGTAGTITDNSVGLGTTVLTATSYNANLSTLIADGINGRKIAVVLSATNNGGPYLGNAANTFSGGLTLTGTTKLRYGLGGLVTTGSAGNIVSGYFGRGTVTVGLAPSDTVQLWFTSATNLTIYNDMVFNTSNGTDRLGAFRLGATGTLVLAGKLTAALAPLYINADTQTPTGAAITGQITGTNGLTLNGLGGVLFVLSNTTANANNYQGTTTLSGGATLQLGAADQIPSGAGCGNVSLAGTLNLAGYNQTINGLSGAGTIDGGSGTPTLTVGANDQTFSFAGKLANTSGSLNLAKTGTGTVTISGANSFLGSTTINGGILQSATNGALATTGTVVVNSGGTLAVNFGGANDYTQGQIVTLLGKTSFTSPNAAFALSTANLSGTYSAALAQPAGLTKLGANTLTLTAANTYTGATTISAGTLQIGNGGTVGSIASTSGVSIASGATLIFNRTDDYGGAYSQAISGSGGTTIAAGMLKLSGSNSFTGPLKLSGGSLKLANPAAIAPACNIDLGSASNGVLWLANDAASNLTFNATTPSAGTGIRVIVDRATAGAAYDQPLTLTSLGQQVNWTFQKGGLVTSGTSTLTASGATQFGNGSSGKTTILNPKGVNLSLGAVSPVALTTSTTSVGSALMLDGDSTGNKITGVISNTNGGSFSYGANTVAGTTAIYLQSNTGIIAGLPISASSLPANTVISAAGGAFTAVTGTYYGTTTVNVSSLTGFAVGMYLTPNANISPGTYITGTSAATLTLNQPAVNSGTLSTTGVTASTLTQAAISSANVTTTESAAHVLSLAKAGQGTWTLTGQNTYTGVTGVQAGTLMLDFSAPGAPTSNIISSASALYMSGGTLSIKAASSGTTTQSFANIQSLAGNGVIKTNANGGTLIVNLGPIGGTSSNGRSLLLDASQGGTLATTSSDIGSGVLLGSAIYYDGANYNYAHVASGTIGAAAAFAALPASAGGATSNYSLAGSGTESAAVSWQCLKLSTTGAGQSLTLLGTTGIGNSLLFTGPNDYLITGGAFGGGSNGGTRGIYFEQYGTGKLTVNSVVNAGSNGNFTKDGSGTLILNSGSNLMSGVVALNAGTLAFTTIANGGVTCDLGVASNGGGNLLLNGGVLKYMGASGTTDRSFTIGTNGATIDASGTSGALTWNPGVAISFAAAGNAGYQTYTAQNQYITLTGTNTNANTFGGSANVLTDSNLLYPLTVTKSGVGKWVLAGTNSYTGNTYINGGTLAVAAIETAGTSGPLGKSGDIVFGGGTLQYSPANAADYSGRIANSTSAISIDTNGRAVTFASSIAANNTGGLIVKDTGGTPGSLTLSASNSYSGGTTVASGTLQIGNTNALGTGGLTINDGVLDLHGNSIAVSALGGAGGTIANTVSGTSTLTATIASGTATYAGAIVSGSGAVALHKEGAGTLLLSGSISAGAISANGGVTQLALSGSVGAVSVGASGTLALSANGVNTAKVLQTNSLSIAAGGTLDLWDNALILRDPTGGLNQSANLAMVQSLVNGAANNGNWNKPGITSSTVIADLGAYSVLTVMIYDNTVLGIDSFEGITGLQSDNGGNQILLKTTYLGDFDGTGIVNSADYGWLDFYYGYGLTVGDLNGDGQVNSADYNGIDYGYGYQAYGVLAGDGQSASAASAASATAPASPEAVPEPGILGMLLASAASMLGFRRQRRHR